MQKIMSLFFIYLQIGALTFGGGYAMLPMIKDEMIRNKWFDMEELLNFIAVSESTPGSFAINVATFTGIEVSGLWGAVFATLGVVLPSFLIILLIAKISEKAAKGHFFTYIMTGIRPAVAGLVLAAAFMLGIDIYLGLNVSTGIIMLISVFLYAFGAHPIIIIGVCAVYGALFL